MSNIEQGISNDEVFFVTLSGLSASTSVLPRLLPPREGGQASTFVISAAADWIFIIQS